MALSLPPLNWFRSFEAAARHLNFTAAAEELGLTQSAVSQQIRALETRLGAQLFVRKARGLSITDAGRKLLPQVGSALETLVTAAKGFEATRAENVLTIATSVSVAQWILSPRIGEFLATQNGLSLRFLSTIWPDEFKASIAEVEIRFGQEKQVGKGAVRLMPDKLIAVSSPSDASIEKGPLIEAVGTSSGWKKWAAQSGAKIDRAPTIYVDSYGLALDLAMNGQGIALTSSLLAASAIRDGRIVVTHPAAVENPEGYFLAVKQDSSAAVAFRDWLLADLSTPDRTDPSVS